MTSNSTVIHTQHKPFPQRPLAQPVAQPVATPAQQQQPQEVPHAVQQTIDAEYVAVDLPSGYKFYDFHTLYIRPFKQRHIRKILQGQTNQDTRSLAEVINSTLACEKGYTDLVYRLCHEDYTYLQYWQRMHSLPNLPYTQVLECTSEQHLAKVQSGEWDAKTLMFTQAINKTNLNVINLDPDFDVDFSKYVPKSILAKYPTANMHVMFMKDYIDMVELAEKVLKENKEEGLTWFTTAIPAAMLTVVDATGRELTFAERFELVDDLNPEDSMLMMEIKQAIPEFGVSQVITGKCPRCGALCTTKMVLNAHSFLPEHNFAGNTRP